MSLPHKISRQGYRRSTCVRHRKTVPVAPAAGSVTSAEAPAAAWPKPPWIIPYATDNRHPELLHREKTPPSPSTAPRTGADRTDPLRKAARPREARLPADVRALARACDANRMRSASTRPSKPLERHTHASRSTHNDASCSRDRGTTHDNSAERKDAAAPAGTCEWRQERGSRRSSTRFAPRFSRDRDLCFRSQGRYDCAGTRRHRRQVSGEPE